MPTKEEPKKSEFLFGAATAAHQIEGDNFYNDWWKYEQWTTGGTISGKACNSYELFKEDRKAIQQMNCNSYRFSLEWSRIEPKPGVFSQEAIAHYHEVIDDLLANNIEPIVTIHHYTNPVWFEDAGGWEQKDAIKYFQEYVKVVAEAYSNKVKYWITINEPNVYTAAKYLTGTWHPKAKSFSKFWRVYQSLLRAHRVAYNILKAANSKTQITICMQYIIITPKRNVLWLFNWIISTIIGYLSNRYYYDQLYNSHLDFLAFNFYTRSELTLDSSVPDGIRFTPDRSPTSQMTFLQFVEDILVPLKELSRYNLPLMISENGVVTHDDPVRARYLKGIIPLLKTAIDSGIKLIGYIHWSLIDNFEWHYAYEPRFGLYDFDRKTFARIPKPSSEVYAELVKGW